MSDTQPTNATMKEEQEPQTGLTHECGVFGCVAAGDSQIDVSQVICLGKFRNFNCKHSVFSKNS